MYRNASGGEPLLASATQSALEAPKASDGEAVRIIEAYQRAIWWFIGIGVVLAGAMIAWLDVAVDLTGAAIVFGLLAAGLIGAKVARRNVARSRVADTLGTLGLVWFAGLLCGVISLIGLQLRMPVADARLLALDHTIGIDALDIISWFAHQPKWLLSTLSAAYTFTIPVLFIGMGGLAMIGDRIEVWRAAFCFVGTLLSTCLISMFTPAKGLCAWVSPQLLQRLPEGWACYASRTFDAFYGADPVLRLDSITGVVCFPSFHTIMGLITLAMWRKRPAMLALASAWFLPMLASTLPVGGHYVVDVLAGGVVWAVWFALSRAVERMSPRQTALA